MYIMLDTNMCIYIIKKKPLHIFDKFKTYSIFEIGISSITLSELEYGVEKSIRKEQNRDALIEFLMPLSVVPYDDLAASHYGKIRAYLERRGQLIGPMDMLIAAHARSLAVPLVTNNLSEFKKVHDLRVENWLEG